MDASYHRHDISDKAWALLAPHLPGQRGQWGGIAQDNRRLINAVFWVLRTPHGTHHGVIFLQTMANGALCTSVLFVGAEKESGESCWIF